MTISAEDALFRAVYSTLTADAATLAALADARGDDVVAVYELAPTSADFPFIIVDQRPSEDWSTMTTYGREIGLEVTVYDRARSRRYAYAIADAATRALREASLTLDGHGVVTLWPAGFAFARDAALTQATQSFRVLTEEA